MTGFEGVRDVRTYINIFQNVLHSYEIYRDYLNLENRLTPNRYREFRDLMEEIRVIINNDNVGR